MGTATLAEVALPVTFFLMSRKQSNESTCSETEATGLAESKKSVTIFGHLKLKEAERIKSWKWFIKILKKMFVTLFFSWAPNKVDLIMKIIRPATKKKIEAKRTIFDLGSGHKEHLYSPVFE